MDILNYLVSNETDYQRILPLLNMTVSPNGIYIGVGADQNFTFMATTHPSFSFIIDYHPENQYLHHLFKTCFELAPTRQAYLSILFSKPLTPEIKNNQAVSLSELVTYFDGVESADDLFDQNGPLIRASLNRFKPTLPDEALDTIDRMRGLFRLHHSGLKTRLDTATWQGRPYPAYRDCLLAVDNEGRNWHFLNSNDRYARIKKMQEQNRIIPVVGDWSGEKTLRELASFTEKRGKTVSVLYVSNVEEFLFREGRFEAYMENIERLPVDANSLIVRSVYDQTDRKHPLNRAEHLFTTVVQSLERFISLFRKGCYPDYWNVATLDYLVP